MEIFEEKIVKANKRIRTFSNAWKNSQKISKILGRNFEEIPRRKMLKKLLKLFDGNFMYCSRKFEKIEKKL